MQTDELPDFNLQARQLFTLGQQVSIEASAGTGKTYSLTTAVARLVAEEGIRADQFLLVTFTNEATAELRVETRRRCQQALKALTGVEPAADWMSHMMAAADRHDSIARLQEFLSRYDEVSINTIHGFCQAVLHQAGMAGSSGTDFKVARDINGILDQVITDMVGRRIGHDLHIKSEGDGSTPPASEIWSWLTNKSTSELRSWLANLRGLVTTILSNDGALVLPPSTTHLLAAVDNPSKIKDKRKDRISETRRAQFISDFAREIVDEIRKRCRANGLITYNDMIRLVNQLTTSSRPEDIRFMKQLASQYRVVMVDEFQDTDINQWGIFRALFELSGDQLTLVTVGDPKQAIYRFRGADFEVFLSAVETADQRFQLAVNFRSDAPLLAALQKLFVEEKYDINPEGKRWPQRKRIGYTKVEHDQSRGRSAISAVPNAHKSTHIPGKPLEIRYVPPLEKLGAVRDSTTGRCRQWNSSPKVKDYIAEDVATRVIDLLNGALILERGGTEPRPLTPADIAVLVRGKAGATEFVSALRQRGINAVTPKIGSVFTAEAARQWQILLRALAYPNRRSYARTYALSWFAQADRGMHTDGDPHQTPAQICATRGEVLRKQGITALYIHYRSHADFLRRVLADPENDGLRNLTDLDHIAEILAASPELPPSAGPAEFLAALARMIDGADPDSEIEKRRIETDQSAVQVMTIHASKGLQFPIVILPTLPLHATKRLPGEPNVFPLRGATPPGAARAIDAGTAFAEANKWLYEPVVPESGAPYIPRLSDDRDNLAKEDREADLRRLTYVAFTRAMHKIICYWSPLSNNPTDPFLAAAKAATAIGDGRPENREPLEYFQDLARTSDGTIEVLTLPREVRHNELSRQPLQTEAGDITTKTTEVGTATFARVTPAIAVDGHRRWSYSSVNDELRYARDEAEPTDDLPGVLDEYNVGSEVVHDESPNFAWGGLPAGPDFGNEVHRILDEIDPASPDLTTDLQSISQRAFPSWDPSQCDQLASALSMNINCALQHAFGGRSLADLGRHDRLSELRFDFSLPSERAFDLRSLIDIAIDSESLPDGVSEHFRELRQSAKSRMRVAGYMTGSIDAVFRIGTATPQFIVCDYKTNKLHSDGDRSPLQNYRHAGLEEAMIEGGYIFQTLIYSVALHRYLRLRLADYDFHTHFGGTSYLFLRGLTGATDAADGHQFGHYFWRPTEGLITSLDELFTEGTR